MFSFLKNNKGNGAPELLLGLVVFVVFCFVTYLLWWFGSWIWYELFYEDMVRDTIMEMAKEGIIKLK